MKVKPRHTLDLVVLAAEWGHGRRAGLAVEPAPRRARPGAGGFVMLGKTFKGLTDEMLALADRAVAGAGESTASGSWSTCGPSWSSRSRSTACNVVALPGRVALRFARVLRYREDKTAARGRHRRRRAREIHYPQPVAVDCRRTSGTPPDVESLTTRPDYDHGRRADGWVSSQSSPSRPWRRCPCRSSWRPGGYRCDAQVQLVGPLGLDAALTAWQDPVAEARYPARSANSYDVAAAMAKTISVYSTR